MRKKLEHMETAEITDLISAFGPEEILRDFELKEVKKECGVYRLYMDEKDDESHYPPELSEVEGEGWSRVLFQHL